MHMNASQIPTDLPTAKATQPGRSRRRELKNLMRRDGIWYFHKVIDGKREFNGRKTPFSLETPDLPLAKAKRDAILKAGNGAEVDRVLGRTNQTPATMEQIFAAYRAAPAVRASLASRRRNIADLERMIRTVHGAEFKVDPASSSIITKRLVKDWQTKRLQEILARAAGDVAIEQAGRRSLNSTLKHVQSIFSKEARDDYDAIYLPPNIDEFSASLPVSARKQEEPEALPDSLVQNLLAAAAMLRDVDAGVWATFTLMTWGGLRNKECLYARENWLEEIAAGYRLQLRPADDFMPKGNSRAVILPRDIGLDLLASVASGPQPMASSEGKPVARYLVPAKTVTDRNAAVYRRLNLWLRLQGVTIDAGKFAYRLRKYFLKKVQEQQGLMFAQAAAGHSSAATTMDHYTGRPKMAEPIRLGS